MVFELEDAGGLRWADQSRATGIVSRFETSASRSETNGSDEWRRCRKFKSATFKELMDVMGTRADGWRLSTLHDFAAVLSVGCDLRVERC